MTKKFKKRASDIIFAVAIVALIIPSTREWIMRQIAFAPSVNAIEDRDQLRTYNWQLRGLNTADYDFEAARGKVVFVNFWATWCAPCRAEMPMLQKLYDDYKDRVDFVFVTSDTSGEIQEYFDKFNFDLPSYNSISRPPAELTKTNSIPASYLIDKAGNIVVDKIGAADWNSKKIRNLIDDLIKK